MRRDASFDVGRVIELYFMTLPSWQRRKVCNMQMNDARRKLKFKKIKVEENKCFCL